MKYILFILFILLLLQYICVIAVLIFLHGLEPSEFEDSVAQMSWVPIPLLSPPTVVFPFLRTGALCVVAHVSGLWCVFGWFFDVPAGFLRPGERQPGAQERPQGPVHQQCYVRLPFLPSIYCRLLRCSSLWFLVWTLGDDACTIEDV